MHAGQLVRRKCKLDLTAQGVQEQGIVQGVLCLIRMMWLQVYVRLTVRILEYQQGATQWRLPNAIYSACSSVDVF